jgi:hypothetical protein
MRPYTLDSSFNRIYGLLIAAIAIGIVGSTPVANAGLQTADFTMPAPTSAFDNLTVDGIRFSPRYYYSITCGYNNPTPCIGHNGDNFLSWELDPFGFPVNPNYLGPAAFPGSNPCPACGALLYVDAGGAAFSLKEIDFLFSLPGFDSRVAMVASNGSSFDAIGGTGVLSEDVTFSGAAWENITWLVLDQADSGDITNGIDHLVLSVPEPPTLPLFTVGFIVLIIGRYIGERRVASARSAWSHGRSTSASLM